MSRLGVGELRERLVVSIQSSLSRWAAGAAFMALLAGVVFTGLARNDSAQDMRGLYEELSVAQEQQDELQAQHSRLLLEKSAYSSLLQVEKVALNDLNMVFPANTDEVPQ